MFGEGTMPDDEGLPACIETNFSLIQLTDNTLAKGHDECFEVIRNGWWLESQSEISIKRNLSLTEGLGYRWRGHTDIMCLNNAARTEIGDSTVIKGVFVNRNTMKLDGPGIALGLTGDHFHVIGNQIDLNPLDGRCEPIAGFQLGYNRLEPGFDDIGASFNNSQIMKNTVTGHAEWGICNVRCKRNWRTGPRSLTNPIATG